MKVISLILLASVLSSYAIASNSFTHRIYEVAKSLGKADCQVSSEQIAQNFADQAGVTVLGSLCETNPTLNSLNIVIRYEAAEKVKVVSTYTFGSTYTDKGTYYSKEQCEQYLNGDPEKKIVSDIQRFEDATGLKPFVAFCAFDPRSDKAKWFSQIEAAGTSARVPERTHFTAGKQYNKSRLELFREVRDRLVDFDLDLHRLTTGYAFGGNAFNLFYYKNADTERYYFSSRKVGVVAGLDNCKTEADALRDEMLAKKSFPVVTTLCTSNYSNPRSYDLELVHLGMTYLKSAPDSVTYADKASCEAARADVENKYLVVIGDSVIGSFCQAYRKDKDTIVYKAVIIKK